MASSGSTSLSSLSPVLSTALSFLDAVSVLSALCLLDVQLWRVHSRSALKLARAKRAARDEVLAQMIILPAMDAYAYHPACARMHVYRSPGHDLPAPWLILWELVGWWDEDQSGVEDKENGEDGDEDGFSFAWEGGDEEGWNLCGIDATREFVQLRSGCYPLHRDPEWYAERGVSL